MAQYKRLWITLIVVVVASFSILGFYGKRAIQNAPPIPREVVTSDGRLLFTDETIRNGQNNWQSIGGQQIGSVFGHGAYVAPDWTADWLHREATFTLDSWAQEKGSENFAVLSLEDQAALKARLEREMRTNTYDASTGRLTISATRAAAIESLTNHYADVFANGRDEYAIPKGALTDTTKAQEMGAFFFWTSWVASTNRPRTNNS
jgi:nitric oxide reductase subunit B